MALAYLHADNVEAADNIAETAEQNYPDPENSHNIYTLLGIIAVKRKKPNPEYYFEKAIEHSENLLKDDNRNCDALYAKGLALLGLAQSASSENQKKSFVSQANKVYENISKISPKRRGIVKRTLQLFDILDKAQVFSGEIRKILEDEL